MIRSSDLEQFPHTEVYEGQPYMGGLFFGPAGLICICHVDASRFAGLLNAADYQGIAEFPLADFSAAFHARVMVAESLEPEGRMQ